jgi:glycerol-3-phosphate acyltransferase PlsY
MMILLAVVWGYLLGAVPTGAIVCRLAGGVDLRQQGSGHTGGLNVSRSAGIWAGVLTGVVDCLLGVGAVGGVVWLTDNPWAILAAGVMAVVGHNWSIFIRFGGGIGLSTLAGAHLGVCPLAAIGAIVILCSLWAILHFFLRVHRARTTILVMVAIGPVMWAFGLPLHGILLGVLGGIVVIIKTLPDWNREY